MHLRAYISVLHLTDSAVSVYCIICTVYTAHIELYCIRLCICCCFAYAVVVVVVVVAIFNHFVLVAVAVVIIVVVVHLDQ